MSKSENNPDMKILKAATCKSVTGNSLGYQLGVLPVYGELLFRRQRVTGIARGNVTSTGIG